jgi:hypothetical protein
MGGKGNITAVVAFVGTLISTTGRETKGEEEPPGLLSGAE